MFPRTANIHVLYSETNCVECHQWSCSIYLLLSNCQKSKGCSHYGQLNSVAVCSHYLASDV